MEFARLVAGPDETARHCYQTLLQSVTSLTRTLSTLVTSLHNSVGFVCSMNTN